MNAAQPLRLCTLACALGLTALAPASFAQTSNPAPPPPAGEPGVESDGDGIDDDVDAEPCNAQVSMKSYAPADRTWGMLMFEDRWPEKGDFDFNDLVVAYNSILDYDSAGLATGVRLDLRVLAVGARFTNGLALRVPVPKTAVLNMNLDVGGAPQNATARPAESDLVVDLASDMHALFGTTNQEWVNTDTANPGKPYVSIVLDVRFATPQSISAAAAPFDLFIFNPTRGTEVHLPQYQGTSAIDASLFGTADDGSAGGRFFVTKNGIPFALELPESAMYPKEGVAIDTLYPAIVDYGLGLPNSDTYYQSPVSGYAYGSISVGSFTTTPTIDVSCFTPNPGVCGAAVNVGTVDAPASGLCSVGSASAVTSQGGFFEWTCSGNYSSPTACDAPDLVCQPSASSACTIANGAGSQVCNGSGTGYGTCTLASCNPGYYASGNQCIAQVCSPLTTRTCAIPNGTGTQQCDNLGSQWFSCQVSSCNSGYQQSGNACITAPGGGDVYYQCAGASNYVVFVENTLRLSVNSMRAHYDACLAHGFKAAGSTDNNSSWVVNHIGYSSSQVLDVTGCNCCRVHWNNQWFYNYRNGANGSADDCVHRAGSAPNAAGKIMSSYIPDFTCGNHECQTFKQALGPGTSFGDRDDTEAAEPWYTTSQDPNCSRSLGDHQNGDYVGVPDYLLCASSTLNLR